MPTVDPVILQLKADVDSYNANVSRAQKLTDQKLGAIEARGLAMGQNLKKGFDLAKGAAIAYAASVGVGELIRAAQAGLEYASSLGEQAQQLGVTTDALQVFRFAATQVGLSAEEMDQALGQLTRRIGEAASGTKAQTEAFAKLGISVKDAKGNILETGDAIPIIADALSKIASPAERAAIELDLFGRAGQKLEPLLAGGSAAINELADAARKAGAVLSPELINNADQAADALAKVKFQLQASIATAVSRDSAAIIGLAKSLGTLIEFLGRAGLALSKFQQLNKLTTANLKQFSPLPGVRRQGKREAGEAREEFINLKLQGAGLSIASLTSDLPGAKKNRGAGGSGGSVPVPKIAGGGGGGLSGLTGPTAAEISKRYEDQLASITGRILSALEAAAQNADDRAEIQRRALEFDRLAAKNEIEIDKNYTAIQKRDLLAANERLADRGREKIEFDRKVSNERDAADLAEAVFRSDQEFLQLQGELADTAQDRGRIALVLLDLEQRHQRSILDAILASETAAEADKKRAQIALDSLNATAGSKQAAVSRSNEGPLASLARDSKDVNARIEEAAARRIDDLNATIADTMAKKLGIKDPFLRELLQIFLAKNVFGPLAEALSSANGGGGGFFGSILKGLKLFGGAAGAGGGGSGGGSGGSFGGIKGARASGGYVAPGKTYRVNEGASPGRVEAFMSRDGGKIIPLGQMNALQRGGAQQGGMATVRLELSGDIDARIQRVSGPVAVQVVRATAPELIDLAAKETLSRAGRPRV